MPNTKIILALAVSVFVWTMQPALAATYDVDFLANWDQSPFADPLPLTSASGSFRVTFDPDPSTPWDGVGTTDGLTNVSLDFAYDGSVGYAWDGANDALVLGTLPGVNIFQSGTEFALFLYGFTNPTTISSRLAYFDGAISWYSEPVAFNVSTVPVPAALPFLASGLGALGVLGLRRRRKPGLAA